MKRRNCIIGAILIWGFWQSSVGHCAPPVNENASSEWYARNIFFGEITIDGTQTNACLAVGSMQQINERGELMIINHMTTSPVIGSIHAVLPAKETWKKFVDAGGFDNVYKNKQLWNDIGCVWTLGIDRELGVEKVAKLSIPEYPFETGSVFISFEKLPADAEILLDPKTWKKKGLSFSAIDSMHEAPIGFIRLGAKLPWNEIVVALGGGEGDSSIRITTIGKTPKILYEHIFMSGR